MSRTLRVERAGSVHRLWLNRPDDQNSINFELLNELNREFDAAEADPDCRVVVLRGAGESFCTGMDFKEASRKVRTISNSDAAADHAATSLFMAVLKRMSLMPRIVVAAVEGQASAGGVGLVAASDLVFASPRARFGLPEALWGLLPCCVTPYLIRRVGFQNAYRMTLTTLPVSASRAREMNLVDEVVEDLDAALAQIALRLARMDPRTVADLKAYFREMWLVTDAMEERAVSELDRLTGLPHVRQNILEFVEHQRFPWDRREHLG